MFSHSSKKRGHPPSCGRVILSKAKDLSGSFGLPGSIFGTSPASYVDTPKARCYFARFALKRSTPLRDRTAFWLISLLLAVLAPLVGCGSAVSQKRTVPPAEVRPALEATADQLIERVNRQTQALRSLRVGVELSPVAGSSYSGVIEEYHQVNGFILAQRPAHIRVIGQAPVVAKNIFDMVSDGETFRIFIPSKHTFVVGPAAFERPAKKPIENLRPQHLLDALFWPELESREHVLLEEANTDTNRYYVLTLVRGSRRLEIARKIWFDRADLSVARVQIYAPEGRLVSDIRYAEWQPVAGGAAAPASAVSYPRHIWLARPHDDYRLEIRITTVAINEAITADRFHLDQPPGTELVRVGQGDSGAQP